MRPTRLFAAATLILAAILAAGSASIASADHEEEESETTTSASVVSETDPLSAFLIFLVPALGPGSDEADAEEGCYLDELLDTLELDSTVAGNIDAPETQLSSDACAMLSSLLGSISGLTNQLNTDFEALLVEEDESEDVDTDALDDEEEANNNDDENDARNEDEDEANTNDEEEDENDTEENSPFTTASFGGLELNVILIPMLTGGTGNQNTDGSFTEVDFETTELGAGECTLASIIETAGVAIPILQADGPDSIEGVAEVPDDVLPEDVCLLLSDLFSRIDGINQSSASLTSLSEVEDGDDEEDDDEDEDEDEEEEEDEDEDEDD